MLSCVQLYSIGCHIATSLLLSVTYWATSCICVWRIGLPDHCVWNDNRQIHTAFYPVISAVSWKTSTSTLFEYVLVPSSRAHEYTLVYISDSVSCRYIYIEDPLESIMQLIPAHCGCQWQTRMVRPAHCGLTRQTRMVWHSVLGWMHSLKTLAQLRD